LCFNGGSSGDVNCDGSDSSIAVAAVMGGNDNGDDNVMMMAATMQWQWQ
jgi:hypothetical protein